MAVAMVSNAAGGWVPEVDCGSTDLITGDEENNLTLYKCIHVRVHLHVYTCTPNGIKSTHDEI